MCSTWKKPKYTPRQQESQWMNIMWNTHGQFCDCDDPLTHLMTIINRDGPCPKPESEIKNIRCLLTGADTATTSIAKEEDHGFIEGELEKLFEEDGGDPYTEGDTR